MNIKKINNEADYRTALAEIDGMGDPAAGTEEFARLDQLVTQIEAYEEVHYPISPPSAEAMAEYEAEKRGQSFEEAKSATFAQYDVAMQRLADAEKRGESDYAQVEKGRKNHVRDL